jgi:SSS family solute:Na+ symporter
VKLAIIDIIIIFLYFAGIIAIGLYTSRRNKSTDQYFLAGKSFPGWAIGISFIGAVISSVTFIAIPADAFKTAWLRFIPNLAFPVITLLAAYIFIPFYRRGTITSAYGYLAARFGNSISYYAAVVFLFSQVAKVSTIAYLLSILLESITGWDFTLCLLVVAGVTVIYTVKGGVSAVIWTDVIQAFILLAGAFVCVGYIIYSIPGGFSTLFEDAAAWHKFSFSRDVLVSSSDPAVAAAVQSSLPPGATGEMVKEAALAAHAGMLSPVRWGFSLSEKTALMMLLLGFFQFLGVITDQSTVQRWCAAKTAGEARRSMYVLGFGCLPVWALFQFLGTCLFVYYVHHADRYAYEVLLGLHKAEHIPPHFITSSLPAGFIGVVIAGALAAAMSTLSASINTSSMVLVNDLYKKCVTESKPDAHYLRLGKIFALAVSAVMIAGALAIRMLDAPTLTDLSQQIAAIITSGVPGVFIAGVLTRRINLASAWAGLGASMFLVLWIKAGDIGYLPEVVRVHLLPHYLAIVGNLVAFLCAYGVSLLAASARGRNLLNLTLWNQSKTPLQ